MKVNTPVMEGEIIDIERVTECSSRTQSLDDQGNNGKDKNNTGVAEIFVDEEKGSIVAPIRAWPMSPMALARSSPTRVIETCTYVFLALASVSFFGKSQYQNH